MKNRRTFWIYWKISFLFFSYAWTLKFINGIWYMIPLAFAYFELIRELDNYEEIITNYKVKLHHKIKYQNFWKERYLDLNDKLDDTDFIYKCLKNAKETSKK